MYLLLDKDVFSSATIVADGRDFRLTPELLTIKRTVVKQSSTHVFKSLLDIHSAVTSTRVRSKCHRALFWSWAHFVHAA